MIFLCLADIICNVSRKKSTIIFHNLLIILVTNSHLKLNEFILTHNLIITKCEFTVELNLNLINSLIKLKKHMNNYVIFIVFGTGIIKISIFLIVLKQVLDFLL